MRLMHPFPGEPPLTSMGTEDHSEARLYSDLVNRFRSLEASYKRLREQLDELVRGGGVSSCSDWSSGFFMEGSPYRSVLDSIGHAIYVSSAFSGEITFWNRSAGNLYGWKEYEVIGQRVDEVLVAEEYYTPLRKIMEQLTAGQSWVGQFPFKKRSGEVFMAMVTKSPLYEDGELVGITTVSSDAALLHTIASENLRRNQGHANGPHRAQGLNSTFKKLQWHQRPPIAPVPRIASSVSNLVSKLGLRRREDDACDSSEKLRDKVDSAVDSEDPSQRNLAF